MLYTKAYINTSKLNYQNSIKKSYAIVVYQMIYRCHRCDYQTDNRCNFVKHLERKTICPPILSDAPICDMLEQLEKQDTGKYKCEICQRGYASRSALNYHNDRHHSLANEVKELKQKLELLSSLHRTSEQSGHHFDVRNVNAPTQIINGDHNTTTQQIHIHLHPFGQENMTDITREFCRNCIRDGVSGVIRMLDAIFFNDNKPENHNVKLRSLKNHLVDIYRDPHWEVRDFHEIANLMIHKCTTEITKDVDIAETVANQDRYDEYQSVYNMPKKNVKSAKNHVKAKLVMRRLTGTSTNTSVE